MSCHFYLSHGFQISVFLSRYWIWDDVSPMVVGIGLELLDQVRIILDTQSLLLGLIILNIISDPPIMAVFRVISSRILSLVVFRMASSRAALLL